MAASHTYGPELTVRFRFDRIGRHHDVPDLVVGLPAGKALPKAAAETVHKHAREYLFSGDYEVHVDINPGTGSGAGFIGWGRFGRFTVTPEEKE